MTPRAESPNGGKVGDSKGGGRVKVRQSEVAEPHGGGRMEVRKDKASWMTPRGEVPAEVGWVTPGRRVEWR